MASYLRGLIFLLMFLSTDVTAQTDDSQCSLNKEVFVADADVRFAFMMSLRKSDASGSASGACSLLSREPLQNYLAAEWVVTRLNNANNGTGYVPGIKIGFYGMDDCRSPVIASRNALSFLDSWVPSALKSCNGVGTGALNVGIVGPSRSATATRVASLVRDIEVPIISMASTSAELSDKSSYPTFFRTVPSDDHQMKMIIDILEQLSWTYIAVIYSSDDYGTSAIRTLSQLAVEKGICIHKKYSLSPNNSSYTHFDMKGLILSAKDRSIVLVFIGSRDNAEQFLWTMDKIEKQDGNVIKYGLHVILSDATNTDVSIFTNKGVGFGTISIAASGVFLDDVHQDLMEKVRRVKLGQEDHKLIKEYMVDFPNDDLITAGSLNTFVPLTIHAVFVLAESVRVLHQRECGGVPGVCPKMRTAVENGTMLKTVKNIYVDYASMDPGVPPEKFRENNYTASFDGNGDIKQVNRFPAYTIHQYRANGQYEEIGAYIAGQTELDTTQIKMPNPSGTLSSKIPSSVCATTCSDCLTQDKIPTAYLEGDAYILGVFSLHEPDSEDVFKCGEFRSVANDAIVAEGFLYAIRDLRKITGINFGAIGIDDCYSPLRSTSILSDYFSGLIQTDIQIFNHHIPKEKLVGVVACRSSGCTIPTASFFMPMQFPVISYAASSPDLDDRIDFPYFLRTVPSDVEQARVMLKIVQAMKWEYVGLMYVENNYGAKAMKAFKALAAHENSGVCVAEEIMIKEVSSELDKRDFFQAWSKLMEQDVKVVVFFGIDVRYRSFLKYLEDEKYHGSFIFIGSEDWGNNQGILDSGPKAARGSLTLKVQEIQMESDVPFKNHLATKTPMANDSNIWFREFWQNVFQCNFKGGFINIFSRNCDPSWTLSQTELNNRAGEQRVKQVMNAVYALGKGIKQSKSELCEDEFPCQYLRQHADTVVENIKKQTRTQGSFDYSVFKDDGNGAIGFDVFNIQQLEGGRYEYIKVGTFDSKAEEFRTESLRFYTETGILTEISAKCTEYRCNHCPKPATSVDEEKTDDCAAPVTEYRDSDILLISLVVVLILAILVAIAVIVVCFTRKYRALKAQLENRDGEIYAEPDRMVYQEYSRTHGIKFANAENSPYPELNGVGSNREFNRGISNPNFTSDNIDSVSQVLAIRNQQRLSQPDLRSRIRDPASIATPSPLTSYYSSRPLPVSPEEGDPMANAAHDNMAYHESSSDTNNVSNYPSRSTNNASNPYNSSLASDASTGGQRDRGTLKRTPDSQSVASSSALHVVIPSSMVGEGGKRPEGVVYYIQGPNGQLTAQVTSPTPNRGAAIGQGQGQYPIQHQMSAGSSSGSDGVMVNPTYGPYSTLAAQQQQQQQLLQQQQQQQRPPQEEQQSRPVVTSMCHPSPQYGNTPVVTYIGGNNIELQEMRSPERNPQLPTSSSPHPNVSQPVSAPAVQDSPIHYASPSHTSQSPIPQDQSPTHYHVPPQRLDAQMLLHRNLPISNINASSVPITDTTQPHQSQDAYQQTPLQSSQSSQDRSYVDHNQMNKHSPMSQSIPDVVGQSFDSLDLSSSSDIVDNIETETPTPRIISNNNNNNNVNNMAHLGDLSALHGNISRV